MKVSKAFAQGTTTQDPSLDSIKVSVTKNSITDYNLVYSLANGSQVSGTLKIIPDVTYTTTAQDIEFANATGGKELLNFKREAEVIDGVFKSQLSYFIPYSQLPDDIVSELSSKEQTATTTVNQSSFAEGHTRAASPAATIVPVGGIIKIYNGVIVQLVLDAADNFLDAHSQISTTTDYAKRIEKLAAIKDCIENPILQYADANAKDKLLELFDETVLTVKVDAIGSFIVGVGQGAVLPPLVSILLSPLFNAEAAVFDNDADNEIATMSKAVGNCEKKKEDFTGDWKIAWEFQRTRLFEYPETLTKEWTITENNRGEYYFTIICEEVACTDKNGHTVKQSHFTWEQKNGEPGEQTVCTSEGDSGIINDPYDRNLDIKWLPITNATFRFLDDEAFLASLSEYGDKGIDQTCKNPDGKTYVNLGPPGDIQPGIEFSFDEYRYVGPDYNESHPDGIPIEMRDGTTVSDSIDKQFDDTPYGYDVHVSGQWKVTLTKLNQQPPPSTNPGSTPDTNLVS